MDVSTHFSAVFIVSPASMDDAICGFEAFRFSLFWHLVSMHGEKAFPQGNFSEYLKDRGVHFRLATPRRYSKNSLKSKNGVIRRIFLKLQTARPGTDSSLLAPHAVGISNDLYGNYVMLLLEIDKGFTIPLESNYVREILGDVVDAHNRCKQSVC